MKIISVMAKSEESHVKWRNGINQWRRRGESVAAHEMKAAKLSIMKWRIESANEAKYLIGVIVENEKQSMAVMPAWHRKSMK
jgi:hypothetical protein